MKKKWMMLGLLMVLSCALVFAGCNKDAKEGTADEGGATSDKIHCLVGYWGGTCEAPIYVAYEKGYFEECGLDVELLVITADTATLMASEELDCYELTPDQFKPMENGLEVKIIDSLHKGCIQGAAAPESGIETVADLEGKTVAAKVGGIAQIQISSEMVKRGLDPKKVNWVTYENAEAQLAMENGEVDAFAAYDPWPEIAILDGATRFYSNTYDEGLAEYLCCFVGLRKAKLEAEPETAGRLAAAFKMACAYLEANPDEAAEMILAKGYIAGDAALNAKLIRDYTWIAGDKELLDASFNEIWHQIYRAGALDNIADEEALAEFIQKMYDSNVYYAGEV